MTNDITSELAKLHELTGVEFSRQVERIAKRKQFHPLETDKDIFTTGGEQSDDYENLLQTARKYNTRSLAYAIKSYFEINSQAVEVLIFKGGKRISVMRHMTIGEAFFHMFKKAYER